MTSPDLDTISPREAEILVELGNHLTNAEIAQKLHISVRTVESHVSALLRKLGAANRRDLVARGLQAITPTEGSPSSRSALAQTMPAVRHNIPSQASSFVGRESELARVTELLGQARLVTLLGPGGVGKTRLALQVAVARLEARPGGVWFVDLASLSDPSLLAARTAGVLGMREEPGRPVLETLADHLRNEEILLLLDNCEHVVGEAASLALGLVENCQKISVLATSREPLGIQGERIYRVPSLSLPSPGQEDPEVLAGSEAVRLFCERAEDQGSGFSLNRDNARPIANLCRRLDGLPLAIELATARMRSLSVSDIEARLDQRFRLLSSGARTALPRHQTLRALIDWSYDLLEDQESRVLMRLSVFAGGFDLKAAEAVARGDDADSFAIVDHLSSLVDKSLIYADGSGSVRYRLLETIREYASAKLTETGPKSTGETRKAHRDYFLSLAEDAAPHVSGSNQVEWLERLELELDNFRLALSYCLSDPDPQPGLRLSAALWDFWHFRDHVLEGVSAICAQVDRPESLAETALRGHALVAAGNLLARFTPDLDESLARSQDGLNAGRACGDQRLVAHALHALAIASGRKGELHTALDLANEGLASAESQTEPELAARLHLVRANVQANLGEDPRSDLNEAFELFTAAGNGLSANLVLNNIANGEIRAGELDAARDHSEEALRIATQLGHRIGICFASYNRGLVAYLEGDSVTAKAMFVESLQIAFQSGESSEVADALLGLALTNSQDGSLHTAATLHGACDAIDSQHGGPTLELQSRLRAVDRERLVSLLGEAEFAEAHAEGQRMPIEACVILATR